MSDEERDNPEVQMDGDDEEDGVGEVLGELELIVEDGDGQDSSDDDESSAMNSDSDEADSPNPEAQRENFDLEIPIQHRYLGESQEVAGRVIFDENVIQDLPIISKSGIILMPGQTIPITFFHPSVISMMKRLIQTTKTFGVIQHREWLDSNDDGVKPSIIGTTAEIFEYFEPSPESLEVGLKIKAKGRQRFKVISSHSQIDGNKVAEVKILEEINPPNFLDEIRLRSRDRRKAFTTTATATATTTTTVIASEHLQTDTKFRPISPHDVSAMTAWPSWVYDLYSGDTLVKRVHKQMENLKLFSQAEVKIPRDPKELSFWVATNLPLDDGHRLKILEINCSIQRLRYELSLIEKYQILCCRNCGEEVARQENIFSMSCEGPQGAYVNPGGVVHETLTLDRAQNLTLIGRPSTEYSWFPGYSWTICQCQVCECHMGWKFKATNRKLHPQKFWGLSRRSLRPKIEILPSMNTQDQIRPLL